ncbi:MAG: sensor histidine kinase [Pseudomonadota bacterium]|nr:HAMP domain-containing protein [Pseudomonadota bacterium]QKK06409.1 MAG: sensor histidine kinase [Pseudomonadota bacterium]
MSLEPQKRTVFRLHTVFGAILLFVLLLPLSGAYLFRIYENDLVRQTESELIAQAVYIAATYKALLQEERLPGHYGLPVPENKIEDDPELRPVLPQLDLRHARILPPREDGKQPDTAVQAFEHRAGKKLAPILHEAQAHVLSSTRVLNPQGIVISGTAEIGVSLAHPAEVQAALKGNYSSVIRRRISDEPPPPVASLSRGTHIRVFTAMPVILENRLVAVVYLSRSPRNVLKALYEEKDSVFWAGLFVLTLTGMIAWLLSQAIGKPLKALNLRAQSLIRGEKQVKKLPTARIAELSELMDNFEKMSAAIETRSDYIRSLSMHLAHEFKTPLASIQGAIELMRDHKDMPPDQHTRFMENITHDTDRLKRMVTRLLELARADVMQPAPEETAITPLLKDLRAQFPQKIILNLPSEDITAQIGADILESVLTNVIENSFQNGAKNVTIRPRAEQDSLIIDITDDGPGISAGNRDKIFTPFFTTRRESGGTGLGLVICRSLLSASGASIDVLPAAKGAHIRLRLATTA